VVVTAADNAVAINANTSVRHHHGGRCGRLAICAPFDKKFFCNKQVKLARAGQPPLSRLPTLADKANSLSGINKTQSGICGAAEALSAPNPHNILFLRPHYARA
jgi:hypothetical protein